MTAAETDLDLGLTSGLVGVAARKSDSVTRAASIDR